jgi:hypothetical protein
MSESAMPRLWTVGAQNQGRGTGDARRVTVPFGAFRIAV